MERTDGATECRVNELGNFLMVCLEHNIQLANKNHERIE